MSSYWGTATGPITAVVVDDVEVVVDVVVEPLTLVEAPLTGAPETQNAPLALTPKLIEPRPDW